MKKWKSTLIIPALLLLTFAIIAQEKKKAVAVLEIVSSGELGKSEVISLTRRFRDMLVQTHEFNVLERDKMDAILQEQDFILSDNCNSAECAVQVGQLLGVEAVITGDIGRIGELWTVSLRMVDMTTGAIEKTETMDYQGNIEGLLDVMRQIAFIFAGKTPPKDQAIRIVQNAGQKKTTPRRSPGPFRIEAMFMAAPANGQMVIQNNHWQDKPERVMFDQFGFKWSLQYQLSSHFHFGLSSQLVAFFYKDTIGDWRKIDLAAPELFTIGGSGGYHTRWNFIKPFVEVSGGYFVFKVNPSTNRDPFTKKDIARIKNLHDETGFYGSVLGGCDLELFWLMDLRIAGNFIYARTKPMYGVFLPTVGLIFHPPGKTSKA